MSRRCDDLTPQELQDAVVADLKELFKHTRRNNSLGAERAVAVYSQDVPIRDGDDEGVDKDGPPEPYVIVRLRGGKLDEETSPHVVGLVLVVCVTDMNPNRQGYRDTIHIVNEIYRRYATNGVIGGKYVLQYPIEWATQDEDTHPYYFAAMNMNVEMVAYTKEVPYT